MAAVGWLALGVGVALAGASFARGGSASEPTAPPYGYFDFPTCVRYALAHSERFLKSRIDIQVHSIDVKDAHSELLPSIHLITRFVITRAGGSNANPFNVQFYMQNWDPYSALLKIKAYEIIVDIAKLAHLEKISEQTADMAKLFYRVHCLEKEIKARRQLLALHRDKVSYGKARLQQGQIDSVQERVWSNALKGEQLRIKDLEKDLDQRIFELKLLMGYGPDCYLALDTRDAANQILGGFMGELVTFTEIQGSNSHLKILAKEEQLQSNRVAGSYMLLLPKPILLVEDVQNQVDRTSGFNLALGLETTLWDGFRRVRDIRRQKMKAEQLRIDRDLMSQKLYSGFRRLRGDVGMSGERETFLQEQAQLAELNEERAFTQFKAGNVAYEDYMDRRVEKVEAHLRSMGSVEVRVSALIDLATMAGGLEKYNARIRY